MSGTILSGSGDWIDVTPHDTNELIAGSLTKGFQCRVGGDVSVITEKGQVITIPNCVGGVQHAGRFKSIRATNTTATGIVAFF